MFRRPLGDIREKKPLSLRLYNRVTHKYDVHDLGAELQRRARGEAADYVLEAMPEALMFPSRWSMLGCALREASVPGCYLEFGVEKADSINFCARILAGMSQETIHGFDSFEGLPEEWAGTAEHAGKFGLGGRMPSVLRNATLHKGWFADTLPAFLQAEPRPVAFVHIDCDLYSSTKTVLDAIASRLVPGSIVVFDEYFNYHGWRLHEFKAWQECIAATGLRYRYRGFCARGKQVYLRIV